MPFRTPGLNIIIVHAEETVEPKDPSTMGTASESVGKPDTDIEPDPEWYSALYQDNSKTEAQSE